MPPVVANRPGRTAARSNRLLVVWSQQEDDLLREQVRIHGVDKWSKISSNFRGKTSRQCRRRWHMFLNVSNKRGGWTAEEDRLLLEVHSRFGNRWTEIAKKLPGRTDNAVKNRFCVLCKKQARETENSLVGILSDGGAPNTPRGLDMQIHYEQNVNHGICSISEEARRSDLNLQWRTTETHENHHLAVTEQQFQTWKELDYSEGPSNMNQRLWESLQTRLQTRPSYLQSAQGTQHTWMRVEGSNIGEAFYPPIPYEGSLEQWEGFLSAIDAIERSSESFQGDTHPSLITGPPTAPVNPSSHLRRPLDQVENLQQRKRLRLGEVSVGETGTKKESTTSRTAWGLSKPDCIPAAYFSQDRASGDIVTWWNERDIRAIMMSAYEGQDNLRDFEDLINTHIVGNEERQETDENIPNLNEMNLRTASGSQRRSCMLQEKQMVGQEPPFNIGEQIWSLPTAKRTCTKDSQQPLTEPVHRPSEFHDEKEMNHHMCHNKRTQESEDGVHATNYDLSKELSVLTLSTSILHEDQWDGIAAKRREDTLKRFYKHLGVSDPEVGRQQAVSNYQKMRLPILQQRHDYEASLPSWENKATSAGELVFVPTSVTGVTQVGNDGLRKGRLPIAGFHGTGFGRVPFQSSKTPDSSTSTNKRLSQRRMSTEEYFTKKINSKKRFSL